MAARKKTGTAVATIKEEIARQAAVASETVGGTGGGNRIRVTQGKKFVDPDGNESTGPIMLTILDYNSQNLYYGGPFEKDNPVPPDCFALSTVGSLGGKIDHLVPSDNAPEKQAEACNLCPMNQFGSAANGKGKACKNTRVLAVINPDLDPAEAPINTLSISPSGLKRFDTYVRTLASKSQTPITVVTEVTMDEDEDYPTLHFKAVAVNNQLEGHWLRRAEAQALLDQEPDLTGAKAEADPPKRPAARRKAKAKTRRRVA